jgi:phosphatidylglycerol---prolipoprotein diacylglyceryl transferase
MFIFNINPVLLQLGPLQIRYYGLVYALGFLTTFFLLHRIGKQAKIKNFDADRADTFTLYLIIGIILGARLFEFLFYETTTLFTSPLEFFMIWHGGMSFHGGIIGAVVATVIFCKRHKVSFYKLADFMVMPAAFFLFLGRIANFLNGELVGTKTTVPWCVVFPDYDNACRHPSQLYEAAKNLVIFFTVLAMNMKKRFKDGVIFWTFVLMYGILRFIENFWREDPRLFGLSEGQYLSLLMIPVAIFFLIRINKRNSKAK